MPVIAAILGITIRMYFQRAEHNPPHVHVSYGERAAAIAIADGAILDGSLPQKQLVLTRNWIRSNQDELNAMWNTQMFHKLN